MLEFALNNFKSYRNKKQTKYSFFYSLDCHSGEGLINPLLPELKKISPEEFEYYLNFFKKKCIYVNRSFSDAVEFLSIWLEKSPYTLLKELKIVMLLKNKKKELEELKNNLKNERNRIKKIKKKIKKLEKNNLKNFFNRTEYNQEGNKWCFPKLLNAFLPLVKENVTTDEILNYVFEIFDFFNMPDIFVIEIIGYDLLEKCITETPVIFRQALLLKVYEFVEFNKKNDIKIGLQSQRYLQNKARENLALYVKEHPPTCPSNSFGHGNQSDSRASIRQSNCFRSGC